MTRGIRSLSCARIAADGERPYRRAEGGPRVEDPSGPNVPARVDQVGHPLITVLPPRRLMCFVRGHAQERSVVHCELKRSSLIAARSSPSTSARHRARVRRTH